MGNTRSQESNAALVNALSGRYAAVLERIPVSVPLPAHELQPQSVEDELLSTLSQVSPGHDLHDSNNSPTAQRLHAQENGAEDAARELEESVLGPSTPSKGKSKIADAKRAPYAASDASSSDLDIPITRDQGRTNKKRKVGKDSDITADVERSIAEDQRSVASGQDILRLSTTKGRSKGKGKSGIREQSVDSVSATPKASRKRGSRRKLDGIAPQTLETLGLGSAPASVAGDITPNGSRPPSPTLTATSATVFEMDMVIPPLKKAKKVVEATMLKRIKALEESQRKVWKNIARKEIPKANPFPKPLSVAEIISPGVQVLCDGLSTTPGPVQARSHFRIVTGAPTLQPYPQSDQRCAGKKQASYARDACVLEEKREGRT
jgi:DNA helicase INO80